MELLIKFSIILITLSIIIVTIDALNQFNDGNVLVVVTQLQGAR